MLALSYLSPVKAFDFVAAPAKAAYNKFFPEKLYFHPYEESVRHFRSFFDIEKMTTHTIRKEGAANKFISGSEQFSLQALKELICRISMIHKAQKIMIINLREESHGFINGQPVTWRIGKRCQGNRGKTVEEIRQDENTRVSLLSLICFVWKKIVLFKPLSIPVPHFISHVSTEEQEINQFQQPAVSYYRLPVTDHFRPTDQIVDEMVKLILNNPNTWLHFHCAGGRGRTTTAMAVADMLHNAKILTLDEILTRQREIGGENLNKTTKEEARERVQFLKNFYQYCQNSDPTKQTWTAWIEDNGIEKKLI